IRAFDRDPIRGGHYGQRSCEPRKQAEHMAAPTSCRGEESPCQRGAVHTWHFADMARYANEVCYQPGSGHGLEAVSHQRRWLSESPIWDGASTLLDGRGDEVTSSSPSCSIAPSRGGRLALIGIRT